MAEAHDAHSMAKEATDSLISVTENHWAVKMQEMEIPALQIFRVIHTHLFIQISQCNDNAKHV